MNSTTKTARGAAIAQILWGLWLLPLGLLVFRSGFLPRILGGWLIINGLAYVTISLTGLLSPEHVAVVSRIAIPALVGELAFTQGYRMATDDDGADPRIYLAQQRGRSSPGSVRV